MEWRKYGCDPTPQGCPTDQHRCDNAVRLGRKQGHTDDPKDDSLMRYEEADTTGPKPNRNREWRKEEKKKNQPGSKKNQTGLSVGGPVSKRMLRTHKFEIKLKVCLKEQCCCFPKIGK
jgi:hypothetical protein